MKINYMIALLLAVLLLTGCTEANKQTTTAPAQMNTEATGEDAGNAGEIVGFRPVDCGFPVMDSYDFPFLGLKMTLSQMLLDKMDSREIFCFQYEDYAGENSIDYAFLRFSVTTQAQREESGMSVDIFSWEAALDKLGTIGVYRTDNVSQLDAITACDTHEKLGESEDGGYAYYISYVSDSDAQLIKELKNTAYSIYPMHELDMSMGYSAFSADRLEDVASVGSFATEDIFGNTYTQDMFAEYDLTLVNVFTTWCAPCKQEMPELEKLRSYYASQNIRLGVVAVVLDARNADQIDSSVIEEAKTIYRDSGVHFPFLIPDEGQMNGRLTGIAAVPESFFVDSQGNIVSDPISGAKDFDAWQQLVQAQYS